MGLQSAILQILDQGFFHADPHPGNMVITADNRLCLMDWGMVGRLTPDEKNDLLFLIRAAVDKDSPEADTDGTQHCHCSPNRQFPAPGKGFNGDHGCVSVFAP
jgi:predicted unusual protein kinase regulating ubiquinone biosynthesis (AarF/ABC1/UbiB family)